MRVRRLLPFVLAPALLARGAAAQRPDTTAAARTRRADALVRRADTLVAAGDTLGALARLDSAIRADWYAAHAWNRRGVLAWALARPHLRDGLVQSPTWIRWSAMADSSLRLAAAIAPDSARYALDVGNYLVRNGVLPSVRYPATEMFERGVAAATRGGDSLLLSDVADEAGLGHWRRFEPWTYGRLFTSGFTMEDLVQRVNDPRELDHAIATYTHSAPSDMMGEIDYIQAAELFTTALRANPNNPRALRHTFMALVSEGRWQEVRAAAAIRLRAAPWDPWAWLATGLAEHRLGRLQTARVAFDSGLAFLAPPDRARFTRLSRLLRPSDTARVAAMPDAQRAATERLYWTISDPLALTPGNEHWLEFLSRVVFAELRWTSEDFDRRGAETAAGDIYVRYGPPDDAISGGLSAGHARVMWRYDFGPTFVFDLFASTGSMRLVSGEEFVEQLPVSWRNVPVTRAMDSIRVQVARFRAAPDSADVVVFADVPVGRLTRGIDLTTAPLDVAMFAFELGAHLLAADSSRQVVRLRAEDSAATMMRAWRRRVPAGGPLVYRVEALQPTSAHAARALGQLGEAPRRGFAMSDLLVVGQAAARGAAPARWSDLLLTPGVGTLRRGERAGVVWESYELAADSAGRARYRVELALARRDSSAVERLVARVVAGTTGRGEARAAKKASRVALAFTREVAAGPVALDFLTLDVGDTSPGRYLLVVTVTDLVSGQQTTRERGVTVVK